MQSFGRVWRLVGATLWHAGRTTWTVQKYIAVLGIALLLNGPTPGGGSQPHPLAAQAQVVSGGGQLCRNAFGPRILQTCNLGFGAYPFQATLDQMEQEAVELYLSQHGLPSSEANLVYLYGRTDLRNEIRGNILTILKGVIAKTSGRTPYEQSLHDWLQGLVQANEIKRLESAIAEFRKWQSNPCLYRLDADVAREYGLAYNGLQACLPQSQTAFGPPLVPAASYFLAYGLKESFGAPGKTDPSFAAMITNTMTSSAVTIGIAVGTGIAAGAAAWGAMAALVGAQFFVYANSAAVVGITAGATGAGVAAIVVICVVVGVIAVVAISDNENQLRELRGLNAQLTAARATPPVLVDYLNDSSGLGLFKITASMAALTLPNPSSTAVMPSHAVSDPSFEIYDVAAGTTAIQTQLLYSDPESNDWAAETTGGWLRQTQLSTSACRLRNTCTQADAFNGTIRFKDWNDRELVTFRLGNVFAVTKKTPVSTDVRCPLNPNTGLTAAANVSNCIGYVSDTLYYKYRGGFYSAKLTTPPFFSSAATANFTRDGVLTDFAIDAGGLPLPDVTLDSSSPALPTGLTFTGSATLGRGKGRLRYAGSNATAAGAYTVVVKATGPNGSTTQRITVNIYADLRITSPNSFSVSYGQFNSMLIQAVGRPPLRLSLDVLASGYTFTDLGNGTGRLEGTTTEPPGITIAGICIVQPTGPPRCPGVTVSGPQGSVTQPFSMFVKVPAKPSLTLNSAIFEAGIANRVRIGSQGGEIASRFYSDWNLPWLSIVDNGNGTADLFGTPPFDAPPSSRIFVDVHPAAGLFIVDTTPNFTLTVRVQPSFRLTSDAVFTVGKPGSFTIPTNQTSGVIRLVGELPSGLQFQDNGNGTATIFGTPPAGSGGFNALDLTVTSNTGTGTARLYVVVNEAPAFKSVSSANFYVGQPNTYLVNAAGYPSGSSVLPPIQGMLFTVEGLPPSLRASNLTPQGITSGTLVISGTPTAADIGTRNLRITANNTIGTPAVQNFTIQIVGLQGDVNLDGVVNCADLQIVRTAMGTSVGMSAFDRRADVNNDWLVNILDLTAISRRLPTGTSCP